MSRACHAPGCPESPRGAREFCPEHVGALPENLREALGWAWVAIFRLPGWTSPPPTAEETARYDAAQQSCIDFLASGEVAAAEVHARPHYSAKLAAMLPLFSSRREEGGA